MNTSPFPLFAGSDISEEDALQKAIKISELMNQCRDPQIANLIWTHHFMTGMDKQINPSKYINQEEGIMTTYTLVKRSHNGNSKQYFERVRGQLVNLSTNPLDANEYPDRNEAEKVREYIQRVFNTVLEIEPLNVNLTLSYEEYLLLAQVLEGVDMNYSMFTDYFEAASSMIPEHHIHKVKMDERSRQNLKHIQNRLKEI